MLAIVILLIVIILLAWVILEPPWAPAVPKTRATEAITRSAQDITKTSAGWYGHALARFRQRFPDTGTARLSQFRTWVAEGGLAKAGQFAGKNLAEDVRGVDAWLKNLPDGELGTFVNSVAALCKQNNLKLEWMWDEKSEGSLKQAVSETFTLYALSVWKAQSAHALSLFKAWQAAPKDRKYRTFAQALYTQLVEKGLVKPSAQMLLAPEKERQAHVVAAINDAATGNTAEFSAILQAVADEVQKQPAAKKAQPQAAPVEAVESAAGAQ